MHMTLYRRSYPAEGAPVSVSFAPFPAHQRHTFTAGGVEHEAHCTELRVSVPEGAMVSAARLLNWSNERGPVLNWTGETGPAVSTAQEVFDLAHTRNSGFRMVK